MNIYKGLLFLHGHLLHDDEAAAPQAVDQAADQAAHQAANDPVAPVDATPAASRSLFSALESVLFLGGRPMHPDQPYDREEPFDQLRVSQAGQATAPESRCA